VAGLVALAAALRLGAPDLLDETRGVVLGTLRGRRA
jgi:hypothetical protein